MTLCDRFKKLPSRIRAEGAELLRCLAIVNYAAELEEVDDSGERGGY